MDASESARVLAELVASFRQADLDEAERALWADTLSQVDALSASAAVSGLRREQEWFPTHAQFLARSELERRRHAERQTGAPAHTSCPVCDDTSWHEVEPDEQGRSYFERCPACYVEPENHPKECSCVVCHYGGRIGGAIRNGGYRVGGRGRSDDLGSAPDAHLRELRAVLAMAGRKLGGDDD